MRTKVGRAADVREQVWQALPSYASGVWASVADITSTLDERADVGERTPGQGAVAAHLQELAGAGRAESRLVDAQHRLWRRAQLAATPGEPAADGRHRRQPAGRPPLAAWRRGELQAAILAYLQALAPGLPVTTHEVAKALNSGSGATGAALELLVRKGSVTRAGEAPRRYAAA